MENDSVLIIARSRSSVDTLAHNALPSLGLEPTICTSGFDGLKTAAESKPALIILDNELSDIHAKEVARRLHQSDPTAPIILMSVRGDTIPVEMLEHGIVQHLRKPIDVDKLAAAVERALSAKKHLREKRQLADQLHQANLELGRQAEQVQAFIRIGHAITSLLDINTILSRVIDTALDLCGGDEATVWLREGSEDDLLMVAEKGIDQDAIQMPRMQVRDGLAGQAMRTCKPIRRNSGGVDGIKVKTGYLVQSVVYVPLLIGDRCLGVVSVASRSAPKVFSKTDEDNLKVLADYAAIAIENARLYLSMEKSAQKSAQELTIIGDITSGIGALEVDLLVRRTTSRIKDALQVEVVSVYQSSADQETLELVDSTHPIVVDFAGSRIPLGKGIIGASAKSHAGIFTNDPAEHPDFDLVVDCPPGVMPDSILSLPLIVNERLLAAVQCVNKSQAPFDYHDINLLRAMAMPVAATLENARLFDQVQREQAMTHAVFHAGVHPLFVIDSEEKSVLCNAAAMSLFDKGPDECAGVKVTDSMYLPELSTMLSQPTAVTREMSRDKKTYLTSVVPVVDIGHVVEMQDITYLKELDQVKSDFVTTVSHDLRSPLSAISGFIDLISQAGPVSEKQQEFIDLAQRSTDQMLSLIEDLLDLARMEAGVSLQASEFCMASVAQGSLDELKSVARNREIDLGFKAPKHLPSFVGDPMRLRRAVSNLVSNAIKFTPKGGKVQVSLRKEDGNIELIVEDTGRGIPAEDIPHIFEPFYRVKAHEDVDGSGLGLALVKSIVEAHSGTISVNSRVSEGSQFTVYLPVSPA